jgi:hypothetical protein
LCRPIFAEFLTEAAAATKQKPLSDLARRYASLGEQWTELANAALPDDVALFRQAKLLQAHKAELATTGGTDSVEERRAAWQQLDALAVKAAENFPLTAADCRKLLDGLADRVESLHAAEVAARDAIAGAVTVS